MRSPQPGQFKPFNAARYRVGIVVAQFNADITQALLQQAQSALAQYKVLPQNIQTFHVPGVVEIPAVLHALLRAQTCDALIAIGCVIRGETDHYTYVTEIVCRGVNQVMAQGMPVGFGILTTENHDQALARLDAGATAAIAALQTAKIVRAITSQQ